MDSQVGTGKVCRQTTSYNVIPQDEIEKCKRRDYALTALRQASLRPSTRLGRILFLGPT